MAAATLSAKSYTVTSPDGNYTVTVEANGKGTTYGVTYKGIEVVKPSPIGITPKKGAAIGASKVKKAVESSHNGVVDVPVGKNASIKDNYNQMSLIYDKDRYTLNVRAYDEGVAFQWALNMPGTITVTDEIFTADFGEEPTSVIFPQCDTYTSDERDMAGNAYPVFQGYRNFERDNKRYDSIASIPQEAFCVTPAIFTTPQNVRVAITEANVYDYPGLYMMPAGGEKIKGHWAAYPKKVIDPISENPNGYYSTHLVREREDYIARIDGKRTLPWRVIIATDNDAELLNNELVYLLADPCEIEDTTWLRPGKSAWEWWHKAVLDGVDFPNGNHNLSAQLYKYYIDWAAENGIEYMTLDAGWSESYLKELCDYGKDRGVGIIVWTWASNTLEAPTDWIKRMKQMGVAGAKIDFFERNDQPAMRWQRELAKRLADEKMMVIFHGCPVPSGLNRTFPNVLGYEASRGSECNFWDRTINPTHHTTLPFVRTLVGPVDFTAGSMRQVTAEAFQPIDRDNTPPMTVGTRTHEMALFVVFDQWLATICDSPTQYRQHPEIEKFLSLVPSTWDETLPLSGKIGEHVLVAKRKGDEWWIGAITNDDARTLELALDFLAPGTEYDATIMTDRADSEKEPTHYVTGRMKLNSKSKLPLTLAPAGGAILHLTPSK